MLSTPLLQCPKGIIKVESALSPSRIACYLQHIKKEDYQAEQANDEAEDPEAKLKSWENFSGILSWSRSLKQSPETEGLISMIRVGLELAE